MMTISKATVEPSDSVLSDATDAVWPSEKSRWETPTMEDVSEQVMAQPYIRFT